MKYRNRPSRLIASEINAETLVINRPDQRCQPPSLAISGDGEQPAERATARTIRLNARRHHSCSARSHRVSQGQLLAGEWCRSWRVPSLPTFSGIHTMRYAIGFPLHSLFSFSRTLDRLMHAFTGLPA